MFHCFQYVEVNILQQEDMEGGEEYDVRMLYYIDTDIQIDEEVLSLDIQDLKEVNMDVNGKTTTV